MLSRTAEYALQAIVFLAQKSEEPNVSTDAIAQAAHVPPSYLVKVLGLLARAGLVESRRGLYGGYTLARDPAGLTFLDIINAVDPIRRMTRCPVQLGRSSKQPCPLHEAIDRATAAIEHEFASVKVLDLVQPSEKKVSLCSCNERTKTSVLQKRPITRRGAK